MSFGKQMQLGSGGEIVGIDAESKAQFDELSQSIEERWVTEAEGRGIDAVALVEAAKAAVTKHSQ